mmetsp:Transcript_97302/g.280778  ORF Transcript_97302/g.280778 Transcript_97302/m.280778 type:complete len:219 (-) Transcript_97302:204-860(-)
MRSSSNFFRYSRSALFLIVTPAQFTKEDCNKFLSLLEMKPINALVVFSLASTENLPSCASTFISCCCASSASSADRIKRASRLSVLATQVSRHPTRCATSLLAWMTASFRICSLTMPWSSSSITWAMASGSPWSTAILTRVAVVSNICSCVARLSKFSRMLHGILCTSSGIMTSSGCWDIHLMSCSVSCTPFKVSNSKAATTTLSRVHDFAREVRIMR